MEFLDIVNSTGLPTGEMVSREQAHREGIRHRTAHVWVTRFVDGEPQLLLQKRSSIKDSFPGCYDTSSAGHIPAGCEPGESALRELQEELGIAAREEELEYLGTFVIEYEASFHGRIFRDSEIAFVYKYDRSIDAEKLVLQEEEVEAVQWFALDELIRLREVNDPSICVPRGGLKVIAEHLKGEIEIGGNLK